MIGQVIDITDAKHARVDREQNTWLQRIAGELGRIGGWAVDVASGATQWSETVFDIVGSRGSTPPTIDHLLSLLEPRARATTQAAFDRCVQEQERVDLELTGRNFLGRRLTVRIVGEPQTDQRRVVRIVGAMQDITAAKEVAETAARSAEELRNALEHMTDGLCALDREWRVIYANRAGARMLDTTVDDMIGADIWELFPEAMNSAAHAAYADVLARREPIRIDAYHNPKLNRWFEIDAVPTARGLTAYFRDVTDRRAEWHREARILQAERDAIARLRQLDQMKNTFLTAVSHELRTPLAVVEGAASTLQRLDRNLTHRRRRELTDALVEHSGRLRDLLEDLLDLERLTSTDGGIRPEPFDLVELVGRTVSSARGDRVRVVAPSTTPIAADRVQVERIVANLVGNAEKYALEGEIVVEILAEDLHVRIGVHDAGPGIPADQLEAIFEPFHRLDETHPTPGTGVGLALVAQFARAHGGRAWAESWPEGGGHVFVELPTLQPTLE
ncbi:MAG: ATP-binding protein [Nitriliruptoraceae bacterium]